MDKKNNLFCTKNKKRKIRNCKTDDFSFIEPIMMVMDEKDVFLNFKIDKIDNNATILIKNLIKIIYKYESDIVHNIRQIEDNRNFNIKKYEDEFHHFDGEIGRKNIARIFGISYSNFKRNWVKPLNKKESIVFRFKSLLKLIQSTNKYLPEKLKNIADKEIYNYLENEGISKDLRVQIAIIFNNYVDIPLGFSDISKLLGKNRMYLNLLSENLKHDLEFEQINKYFTLLSSIFFLDNQLFKRNNIELNSLKSLKDLKKQCYNLILDYMRENEIINDEVIGEFEVIFYSFLALAENREESFNISDFSRAITNNPKGVIFSSKLRDGWKISIEQCLIMKSLLPNNSKYSNKAKKLLDKYIKYRESIRESEYHTYWYDKDIIRFHCTVLTIRDLCIDILNLLPFPPESFLKGFPPEWYTFNRHHFFVGDKKSINPNRIILTISQTHPNHEGKNRRIRKLLIWRFKGRTEIPKYYQNLMGGEKKWSVYLKRREYIEKHGIGYFILKYLTSKNGRNHFINRFYPNVLSEKSENIFYLSEKDIALKLEKEIKKVIKIWIEKYPKSTPKLPHYAKYLLPAQRRIYKYTS